MPASLFLDHIIGIRALCAASSTFQTLTATDDATEALAFVLIYEADPLSGDVFAVVSDPDEDALTLTLVTGPNSYDGSRSAQLTLFQYVDAWSQAAAAQFLADASAVVTDILTQQGEDDHLYINTARKVSSQRLPFRFVDGNRRGYQLAFTFGQDLYG